MYSILKKFILIIFTGVVFSHQSDENNNSNRNVVVSNGLECASIGMYYIFFNGVVKTNKKYSFCLQENADRT